MLDAAFLIIAGDLTPFGKREDLQPIRDELNARGLRFFPVFGGHDAIITRKDTCNYREFFGPEYYSFNYRGMHFVVLLSETSFLSPAALARQWAFLNNDLARLAPGTPVTVVCHTPDLISDKLQTIQEKYDFTTLLMGHYHQIHRYQVRKTAVFDNSPWRESDWGLHTNRVRIFTRKNGAWNIDEVRKEDLEILPFLNEEQVEGIVKYVTQNRPVESLGELMFVRELGAKEREMLRLFVRVEEKSSWHDDKRNPP